MATKFCPDGGWTKRELAEEFGVTTHTIDKYRKLGHIPKPVPNRGARARYYHEHREAVRRVVVLRDSNFYLTGWRDPYGAGNGAAKYHASLRRLTQTLALLLVMIGSPGKERE